MDEQEKLLQSIGNIFDQKFDERFTPLEKKQEKLSQNIGNIFDQKFDERFTPLENKVDSLYNSFNGYVKNTGTHLEDSVEDFLVRKQLKNKPIKIKNIEIEGKGIEFHSYNRNIEVKRKFEIDFLLLNSRYLGVLEVKRKIIEEDIDKFFNKTIIKFQQSKEYKKIYKGSGDIDILPIFVSRIKIYDNILDYYEKNFSNRLGKAFFLEEKSNTKFEVRV